MNAKKMTPHEQKLHRRQVFAVDIGVYIALVFGVIGSQAIEMSDNLMATFNKLELGQVLGATIIAGVVYNRMEVEGELEGKVKHLGRLLRNAFYHGFFWMTIVGVWW